MSDRTIAVKIRAEYQGFKSAMADIRTESRKTAASLDADGNKITTTSGRMARSAEVNRDAWEKSGRALTLFGAAGAAAFVFSARAAIDWESAWAGVLKTVDGSHDQLAQLEDDIRGMALRLPASATAIAEVASAAGQLGVKVDDVAQFTEVMVNLGETTNLSATEAATALARMANIMGTTVSEVARMGATIVDLGNNSATTEAEIVDLGLRLAAAGKQAGLSEAEVLAFSSALTSVGVPSEAAGTAISKVMTAISDAVKDGGADLETFAKVAGVSTEEFQRAFEEDAAGAIGSFIEGMGNMSAAGESTTAIFDDLGLADERLKRSVLSLGSAHGLLTDQLALANTAWDDNTALVEEANKRYDTTAAKTQIARNALNEAAITVGEDLLPALASLAESLANVTTWLGNLPDPIRVALTGLGGVASVTALAAGGFLLIFPRIIETAKAFKTLKVAMPGAANGLKAFAKGGGVLAAAVIGLTALTAAMEALPSSGRKATLSVAETTQALLDMQAAGTDLSGVFDFSESRGDLGELSGDVDSLADAARRISDPSLLNRVSDVGGTIRSIFGSGDTARTKSIEQINTIGEALASLVQSGEAERAAEQFDALAAEWEAGGGSLEEFKALMPAYTDALASAKNEQRLVTTATDDSTTATQGYIDALTEQIDAQREAAGVALDERAALRNLEQAVDDAAAAVKENGKTLDVHTQKGRDNQAALDDLVTSTFDWVEAGQVAGVTSGELYDRMETGRQAFIDTAIAMGIEETQAIALADEMNLIPAFVFTKFKTPGLETALAQVNSLNDALRKIPGTTRYAVEGYSTHGGSTFADGGPIRGQGSSTSDDIPIWASDGEYMVKARAHSFWGTRGMDAINNADPSGLMQILAARGFKDGGSISNVTYEGSTAVSGDQFSGDVVLRVDADSIGEVQQLIQRAKTARIRARQGGTRS